MANRGNQAPDHPIGNDVTDSRSLLTFPDRAAWRNWLEPNHLHAQEAWLVLKKKRAEGASLSLDEAVREALCFGWIDGRLKSLDQDRYSLRFSPRKPNSVWSISNVRRVGELIGDGLMMEAGLQKVAEGRLSGQWEAAVRREQVDLIPADLAKALRRRKGAIGTYRNLAPSRRKQMLHWLMTSKRPETREMRIEAIVEEVAG
jgi:uncharacterized protein YdeI (YjbR/CyaY-like superfamily)